MMKAWMGVIVSSAMLLFSNSGVFADSKSENSIPKKKALKVEIPSADQEQNAKESKKPLNNKSSGTLSKKGELGHDPNSDLGHDPNSDLGHDPNSDLGQDPNSDLGG